MRLAPEASGQGKGRTRRELQGKYLLLGALVVVYGLYAGLFIFKSSFVLEGQRYFCLFDDSMISMQYARNVARGFGLVWIPGGERVEGISNPLWTAAMVPVHLLQVPSRDLSLIVQAFGALLLILNLIAVFALTQEILPDSPWVAILATFVTAFYYPLNVWGLLGTEVSALTLIVTFSVLLGLRVWRTGKFSPWLYGLLGLATLLRMDAVVPGVVLWGFLAVVDRSNRRLHLVWGMASFALCLGGQTAFRLAYYGDALPNTYYLKMTGMALGPRLARGLKVEALFIYYLNWVLFALPFAVFSIKRDRRLGLLLGIFVAVLAYSAYVGGDAWENRGGSNRFISVAMPLFFISFGFALEVLRQALLGRGPQTRLRWTLSIGALTLMAVASLANFDSLLSPKSLNLVILRTANPFVAGNVRNVSLALFLRGITTPEATIAVVAAGATPYFSELDAVDLLGKSDPVVAHEAAHFPPGTSLDQIRPGHMKYDYAWSIETLQPDIVVEVVPGTTVFAQSYVGEYTSVYLTPLKKFLPGGRLYLRTNSQEIDWDRIHDLLVESGGSP